jgi:DegV family protein with EDD domain
VGVVTDSASSLPVDLAGANGVTVVPMWVAIGGQQYRDGELSLAEVLERAGEGLSTSGPAPGELAEAASAADQGDGVVILTLSQAMSGVYQSARLAMDLLEGEKVAVVDTGTAAGAEGLVVLAAARAARDGLPLGSVVDEARRAADRVRLLATLPSLDYLARGGRVPGAAAWGARWLGLNPVFEFRESKVKPLRPARGSRLARQRIVDIWARDVEQQRRRGALLHAAALHAVEPAVAEELLAEVRRRYEPTTAFVGSFSPVMVAHTGPGLVGLAWWWDEPSSG